MPKTSFHSFSAEALAKEQEAKKAAETPAVAAPFDELAEWKRDPTDQRFDVLRKRYGSSISSAIRSVGGDEDDLRIPSLKILRRSAETFDPDKGAQFSTHLHNNLRGLNRERWEREFVIGDTERVRQRQAKMIAFRRQFESENDRPPLESEIQDELGVTEKQLRRAASSRSERPEDAGTSEFGDERSGSTSTGSIYSDDHDLLLESMYEDAKADDDKIGQAILQYHYRYGGGDRKSQTEIARMFKVSVPAINKRIKKLNETLGDYPR